MKNFEKQVKSEVLALNEKGELKQNVRNKFKADLMKAFKEFLVENEFQAEMVSDGVAVEFSNDELGSVVVVFDGVVKSLAFDLVSEAEAFKEKVSEKELKAKALAEAKAKKVAASKAKAK